ncbi:hypothetical protein FAD88_000479 [Enterococcus faecium]|nr:hypothetical protein [Enterococcus faecium]
MIKVLSNFFSEYNPIEVVVPDDPEEQKKLKTMGIDGFIAGEMKTAHQTQFLLVRREVY